MRILHVSPSIGPLRGGLSTAVQQLCQGLAKAGTDVTLVTTDDNGTGRLDVDLGIPIAQDGYTAWYFSRQTELYCFSWPLTGWLSRNIHEYDCVHIHGVFSYVGMPASVLARINSVPYLITPHGILMSWGREHRRPMLKKLSLQSVEKNIFRGAAVIHYTSEQEKNEVPSLFRHIPSIITPLGIDLEPFLHLPSPGWLRSRFEALGGRLVILFLSRLDSKKGLDILLSSFQQTIRQDVNAALVIAGDGEPTFVESLRKEVARLGIGADVIFTGFLNEKEKVAAMADADIFVLSSRSESFGVAVVEAMACGLPVIISDQIGIHPQVSESGAGFIVPCEEGALTKTLRELAMNDNLRHHMGLAAAALAKQQFSLEAMARAMVEIYERIASHN